MSVQPSYRLAQLLLLFRPLGDDPHIEVSRKIGDGADDGAGFIFVRQTYNEAAVDLDLAEGKTHQVAERGVAGAEIIHRKLHAEFMQAIQRSEIGNVFCKNTDSVISSISLLAGMPADAMAPTTTLTSFCWSAE